MRLKIEGARKTEPVFFNASSQASYQLQAKPLISNGRTQVTPFLFPPLQASNKRATAAVKQEPRASEDGGFRSLRL